MTQDDKHNNDEDDLFASLKGIAKDAFNTASENAATAANDLRTTINQGRRATHKAYEYVQETVGKERIIGAAVGAKVGGVIGIPGGAVGMFVGGTVGTVAGFIGGKKILNWLDAEKSNDNPKEKVSASSQEPVVDEEKAKEETRPPRKPFAVRLPPDHPIDPSP